MKTGLMQQIGIDICSLLEADGFQERIHKFWNEKVLIWLNVIYFIIIPP